MSDRPKVDALPPIVPGPATPIQYVESAKSKAITKWTEAQGGASKQKSKQRSKGKKRDRD